MAIQIIGESPEEREIKNQSATTRRIKILGAVCLISIVARVFIKPPPPPKTPHHENAPFRALPGMLENLPASERAKLTPEMLAKLQEADRSALVRKTQPEEKLAKKYEPLHAPVQLGSEEEKKKDVFAYHEKRRKLPTEEKTEEGGIGKTMLVLFKTGRFIKAQEATRLNGNVEIKVDKSLLANLPGKWVNSISSNGLTWKEPIPTGYTRITPARGISITLAKNIAKRISMQGNML